MSVGLLTLEQLLAGDWQNAGSDEDTGGRIITGAIVVYEFMDAGDDGPYLAWVRDSTLTAWKALGMLESAANDLRHDLLERGDG